MYPDVDDSAVVLMALGKLDMAERHAQRESIRRGYRWVMAMQGSDGGWGAYDKDNNKMVFNLIPFADHRALLDPSTADLTGRCLEMLGALGYDRSHAAVRSALEFLRREQEEDGSWYGRWGVNYIYGTWSVLAGLRAIGEDMSTPHVTRAVAWLESVQNADGGWVKLYLLMPITPRPAVARVCRRKLRGPCWRSCRPACLIPSASCEELIISSAISEKTARGKRFAIRARVFRASSICAITGTASIFLSGRLPCIGTFGLGVKRGPTNCAWLPSRRDCSGRIPSHMFCCPPWQRGLWSSH